jgi:hypothetical protein
MKRRGDRGSARLVFPAVVAAVFVLGSSDGSADEKAEVVRDLIPWLLDERSR